MNTEILSYKTGWLRGRCCDDCKNKFHHTVELKLDGEYLNLCNLCFSKLTQEG